MIIKVLAIFGALCFLFIASAIITGMVKGIKKHLREKRRSRVVVTEDEFLSLWQGPEVEDIWESIKVKGWEVVKKEGNK